MDKNPVRKTDTCQESSRDAASLEIQRARRQSVLMAALLINTESGRKHGVHQHPIQRPFRSAAEPLLFSAGHDGTWQGVARFLIRLNE